MTAGLFDFVQALDKGQEFGCPYLKLRLRRGINCVGI